MIPILGMGLRERTLVSISQRVICTASLGRIGLCLHDVLAYRRQ